MRTLLTFAYLSAWTLPSILASPVASTVVESAATAIPRPHYVRNVTEPRRLIQHTENVYPSTERAKYCDDAPNGRPVILHGDDRDCVIRQTANETKTTEDKAPEPPAPRAKYCANITDGRPVILHGDERDCVLNETATETNGADNNTSDAGEPRAQYADNVDEPKRPIVVHDHDGNKTGNLHQVQGGAGLETDSFNANTSSSAQPKSTEASKTFQPSPGKVVAAVKSVHDAALPNNPMVTEDAKPLQPKPEEQATRQSVRA